MQIASILPINYLQYTRNDSYYMCLAQLVYKSEVYAQFFKDRKKGQFVTLDNGACEGSLQSYERLLDAADLINADEIVLPDVLMESNETLYNAHFYSKYSIDKKVMAVTQGNNFEAFYNCAVELLKLPIDTLGIPKLMTNLCGRDARICLVKKLLESGSLHANQKIHFLGCWNSNIELAMASKLGVIRSCDSAFPWIYTINNKAICDCDRNDLVYGIDFFDMRKIDEELLSKNLKLWRESGKSFGENIYRLEC